MILTTNYDDCVVKAFKEKHQVAMTVCGRRVDDLHYVLNALTEPSEPLLWALQGYLGDSFGKREGELNAEIVVGHEEYRKVAHSEPQFRRAFAEVFRSRSMLFLGSGLKEPYFREMFSEILEIYGPCARPHYAFVKKGDLDPQFMATRFQIFLIEYENHDVLPTWLNQLADAIEQPAFRRDRFSFALREHRIENSELPCSRLQIIRGQLPKALGPGECAAVSAGGAGTCYFFSDPIQKYLGALGVTGTPSPCRNPPEFVARFGDKPVFAVRAREAGDTRALRVVRHAAEELFNTASSEGFRCIRMQLLGVGGAKGASKSYDDRPFSPMFSFVESVRAFGEWCRANADKRLELAIHVVDQSICSEITWRRLDIDELLSSRDLRFWVRLIYPDGRVQRQMCQAPEGDTLGDFAAWLGLDSERWSIESIPRIGSPNEAGVHWVSGLLDEPLSSWVIPGGTLQFTVRPDRNRD